MKVVFDFDGVIHDAFNCAYEIHKVAAEKIGRTITESEYRAMFFGGPFHQNLDRFFNFNQEERNCFLDYKYKIYNEYYSKAKMFDFAKELVIGLCGKGALLEIVSSAPKEHIEDKLKRVNLLEKFRGIYGINRGGKKERLLGADYFVTDTVGDISDGKEAEVKVIAVTWGYCPKDILSKANPDFLVDDYKDIVKIIYG